MKNLKSIIQYECATSFKYVWIFYAIQYALVAFITIIIGLVMGTFEDVGTNFLEINTLIYIGILGVLGFKDDFKLVVSNTSAYMEAGNSIVVDVLYYIFKELFKNENC